ncbi:glycoside hydrolase [Aspergillus similis]
MRRSHSVSAILAVSLLASDSCVSTAPTQWAAYHDSAYIALCNESLLLDLAIYNPLDDPTSHKTILACSVTKARSDWEGATQAAATTGDFVEISASLELGLWGTATTDVISDTNNLTTTIQKYLRSPGNTARKNIFGQIDHVIIGVHVGSLLENSKAVDAVTNNLAEHINSVDGVFNQTVLQSCGLGGGTTLGISVNTDGDLAAVQKHMRDWSDGKCVGGFDTSEEVAHVSLLAASRLTTPSSPNNSTAAPSHSSLRVRSHQHHVHQHSHPLLHTLHARSTCSYVQVHSGDSCASLVQSCGITAAEFTEYNPASDLCSTLAVGQYVCCSKGDLPDFAPQPYANGTCYAYSVQSGDSCSALASTWTITVDEIDEFNQDTWGWMGCNDLQVGQRICLSEGISPFPAPVANAVCGPQVPGTQEPSGEDNDPGFWIDLNPCPLNACCDIWGQCGITPEYCTVTESPTGAPGTAAAGSNGCMNSCGTTVINDAVAPDEFMAVGYYESAATSRTCLNMPASAIDTTKYTHVHYGFGNITADYAISVTDSDGSFSDFKNLTGVKKIISLGGWDFSTNPATYSIFREGVTASNRDTLANNVVSFVNDNGLDGVDFDWEYPGEPDIEGIPAGNDDDGDNYLEFLTLVRSGLTSDQTVSIAAPASYWYLKAFPISDIANVVDYIIYMTYDLHGQWDYGNAFSQDGCAAGNCLRSHVNLTETMYSLAMITKAGVATNKIVVGVTSYGRSFEMTEAGCTGPMCSYTGPDSGATPGICTDQAGYIANAEINALISDNNSTQVLFDSESDSDIIVYDSVQWVAYMTNATKSTRTTYYQGFNFAGTSEWAIDLQTDVWGSAASTTWQDCNKTYATLDDIAADADNIASYCMATYIVGVQSATLDAALENYTAIINDGYDNKFKVYSDYMAELIPVELDAYMAANASKYFTCTEEKYIICCDDCESAYSCEEGCSSAKDCVTGYANVTIDCPSSIPNPDNNVEQTGIYPVHYKCTNTDYFYKDIESLLNVLSTWIHFSNLLVQIDAGCEGSPHPCTGNIYYTGFPVLVDNFTIPNPKDMISRALTNLTIINDMLQDAYVDLSVLLWTANDSAAVDSSILPTSMTSYAVQEMAKVSTEASVIEAAEKKEMILNFIFGILFLLPSLGAAIDAADLATLGRSLTIAGDVGNIGATIYGAIEDPKSAVFAVFALLVGGRDNPEDAMEEAKSSWEKLSQNEVEDLGTVLKTQVNKIDNLRGHC